MAEPSGVSENMTNFVQRRYLAEGEWRNYRAKHALAGGRRRQLRKRDFLAGYHTGVEREAERFKKYVIPMTSKLYDLVRAIEDNPSLVDELRLRSPETVKALVKFLEGKTNG